MATLLPEGKQSFETAAGIPLVGGKVYTYDAGTNNPRTTYQDAAATVPNANPVILDARGEATIFWNGAYKVVLKDALDNTIWSVDNITDPTSVAIAYTDALRAALAAVNGDTLIGTTPGYAANPTTFSIWIKQQVAIAENYPSVQAALNSGAPIVKLSKTAAYNFAAGVTIPSGVTLEGNGKSQTNIVCAADITPFTMLNANDAGLEGVLISAFATQTAPLVLLDAAANTMARCRVRDVQGSGGNTDFPFINVRTRNGAYGSWAHLLTDLSVSGCGSILKAETQFAASWINSINMSHVYANDFIRGMHLLATLGEGVSDMTFLDWATQTSPRTQFGALITDVGTQGWNRKNSFTDVRFYDLIAGALSYYIGTNVLDTTINGLSVDDPNAARIRDLGINSKINGMSLFQYIARNGRNANILTGSGLTSSATGTATTQAVSNFAQLRTGATAGSVARLYSTDVISGLSQNQIFNINFDLPLRIAFSLTRITAGGSALGRVQVKTTQADGALVAKGLGLQINNYDIFGETYGTSVDSLNVATLVDGQTYQVEIIHYPANRVEWWVNGVLKATESTLAKIPSGAAACYPQASLNNVTAVDVQMFLNSVTIQAGI